MRLFPHNNSVDEVQSGSSTEAATLRGRGCNPMRPRLQPHATEAATLCDRGCNPMYVHQVNERQLDALPSRPMRYEAAQHDPTGRLGLGLGLQAPPHRVAGSGTQGCRLRHIGLRAPSRRAAGSVT
eukprot:scaffold56892_cov43-Phaeocystis_antarctica.AAC.2